MPVFVENQNGKSKSSEETKSKTASDGTNAKQEGNTAKIIYSVTVAAVHKEDLITEQKDLININYSFKGRDMK